ncbi:MAG: hypothetical protein QM770_04755 [Tepidisphaeraceae bacterium]
MYDTPTIVARINENLDWHDAQVESRQGMSAIDWLMLCTVVLAPGVLVRRLLKQPSRRDRQTQDAAEFAREFIDRCVFTFAHPMMVNAGLRQPGTDVLPGLFFAHIPSAANEPLMPFEKAMDLGARIETGGEPTPGQDFGVWVDELFADEEFCFGRRRPFPPALAQHPNVYALDLVVTPLLLADGFISDRTTHIPVLAEPGPAGRTLIVPWWFLTGGCAPTPMHEQAWIGSLAYMQKLSEANPPVR